MTETWTSRVGLETTAGFVFLRPKLIPLIAMQANGVDAVVPSLLILTMYSCVCWLSHAGAR